ncbi:FAD-dependent oxidoreductase [Devosia insulae DS-56]|uniref:FAD-dependent oxidoreductase n=1 Tax=Devosia insulae DS-56 TaxID=1116389 RepID=A0A1E5XTQ8_9HYPH|nr:FAD-dependent monooxygenase [Devosia insulae]OEO31995.1 FAD-dependent oxidoreductase [Devosia insulae DS-56]
MTHHPIRTVLISGASVAGPSLAFWLSRYGFQPTIVERARQLREGGYAVDFRGTSMEALRRMELLDAVKAEATNMGDMYYVDRHDREVATMPAAAFSGELEIMRGDLARILYDATEAGTEYIFGDSIAELTELDAGVEVRFESGMRRSFDLVIGADGLHSNVRTLAFGPEEQFVRDLGLYASIFTVPNRLNLDYSGRLFSAPGTIAGVYSARQNREARALMFFDGDFGDYDYRDFGAQKQFVRQRFAGQGWYVPQILADMEFAPDFYFDTISQVVIERWSRGRVALLGDAAHCASPLSGMGTGMAVVGAYILAHELNASRDDHQVAFTNYQRKLQPFVDASQTLAHKAVGGFVPKGNFGIWMRNLMMKLLPLMPADMVLKEAYAAANAISI